MSKKNDMIAALQCKVPKGMVPTWELEFQAWDAASGRHAIFGDEFEKLTAAEKERTMHVNSEILLSVADEMQWSALTVPGMWWEQAPGERAYYTMQPASRARHCEILKSMAPADLMLVAAAGGIIAARYDEEFCLQMAEAPELIDALCADYYTGGIEEAKRFRDLGVEAIVVPADIADNHGPFYSPVQMRRWIYPWARRYSDTIRSLGLFSIFHTDGNLMSYIDDMAACGFDALQAIDPVAGMDIVAVQQATTGKICLCGNIDCGLLLTGKPEEVFEATCRLLFDCKPLGGFVLGASNAVQPDVPIENYRAHIAAWCEMGTMK